MSYARTMTPDYTITGDYVGPDDSATGVIRMIQDEFDLVYTDLNTEVTKFNLNSGEDTAFFFSFLGG